MRKLTSLMRVAPELRSARHREDSGLHGARLLGEGLKRWVPISALVFVLCTGGCGGSAADDAASEARYVTVVETKTQTVTETVASEPADEAYEASVDLVPFDGDYISLEYPIDWTLETAETWKGSAADGYFDTTIRSDSDRDLMVRVDVTPGSFADPSVLAAEVERYLLHQPGYRRLAFESTTFAGYSAFRWDFAVTERGVTLRKSDIFFTTPAGDAYAVLVQAPTSRHALVASVLEQIRASVAVTGTYDDSSPPPVGEADFCETHSCIDYFDEGVGSIVQCADGMWSHSGGRPGACSHHGGVVGGSSGYSGSGSDTNGDGSTYNWCGASRDGDGDGLWCEGR